MGNVTNQQQHTDNVVALETFSAILSENFWFRFRTSVRLYSTSFLSALLATLGRQKHDPCNDTASSFGCVNFQSLARDIAPETGRDSTQEYHHFKEIDQIAMTTYNVFLVDSHTLNALQRDHRALYVETISSPPRGIIFNVRGAQLTMVYEEKDDDPRSDVNVKKIQVIGTISGDNLDQLKTICRALAPPSSPMRLPKGVRRPDCRDWIDDLLVRLNKDKLIIFLDTSVIPKAEIVLQI